MESNPSSDLFAELFDEYSAWSLGLAEDYNTLPRSISGVNPKGEQFFGLTFLSCFQAIGPNIKASSPISSCSQLLEKLLFSSVIRNVSSDSSDVESTGNQR